MKNAYLIATRRPAWQRLCAILITLFSFSFAGYAQTLSITPVSTPGNPQDFGSVQAGQVSASRSYAVSGTGLIRDVTVTVPAGFQGSTDNTTFTANTGATLTLARSGSSVTATIYLRFAPVQAVAYDDFLEVTSRGNGNTPLASDVEVIGTGTPPPPVIGVSPAALGFGGQTINTTSAPQNVTVTGTSLTTSITAVAPTGFLVSYNGSTYATTATLPSTGGTLNVVFAPTQATNYVGDITFNSTGAAQQTVSVSGTGQSAPVVLTVNPNSLSFPNTQVGQASTSQSFTVNASGLTGNVTIAAGANFQVRVGTAPFNSTATITPSNGTVSNVTVDVRFTPTTNGGINETVVVSSPGATSRSVAVSGNGSGGGGGATVSVTPTTISFGNVTQSGSADTRTLTVGGTNLGTTPITLTPSSSNIQLRNASVGGSFVSGPLTLTPVNGTVAPTTVEVRLVAPIAGGAFSQTITATSGSATPVVVTVTANSNGNVSDISITNPANNTFTFATRPATFSVSQSFLISGTNLLQDIVVTPAGTSGSYFQVSTDNVNFFSTVTLARDGQNNVPQQPIYVRFVPGNQAITVNALIRASSSPAPDRDVSVTGISEPTIRLLQPLGSFGDATVKNTKSASKTIRLETFLLTGPLNMYFPNDVEDPGRNPLGTPQYEFDIVNGGNPTEQSTKPYMFADTLLNNADGNRIVNLLVRYAPTRVGAATQELTFTNQALNNNQPLMLLSGNGRASGFAIAEEPTAQSTAQIVRPTGSTTATITFDLGNPPAGTTYGQNRLVIASRTYTLLPTSLFPVDKSNFNPGTTVSGNYQYGTGTTIEASTGTYVVFSGAANSFTVGNLDPNENYYFFAFEFNDDGLLNAENYKVPNNQPQTPLPVELVSFTAKLRNGRAYLNWVTAQEKNNRGFEVQRSQNGRDFQTIGFVNGRGNTTSQSEYNHEDAQPLTGVSYYRLRQLDTDGTPHILPAVSIRNGGKLEVSMYPNPVADKLNVRVSGASSDATVQVTDMMGRVVLNGKLGMDGAFDVTRLKAGTYIVTVGSGDEKVSQKIVKQ